MTFENLIEKDAFLDFVIDELTEAAGYERGFTSPLNLARWDLKAALKKGIERYSVIGVVPTRGRIEQVRQGQRQGSCPCCGADWR